MSYDKLVNSVYNELRAEGRKVYKKEIKQYINCYDKQDYTEMFTSDIYINRGGAYCRMIEKVYDMKGDI